MAGWDRAEHHGHPHVEQTFPRHPALHWGGGEESAKGGGVSLILMQKLNIVTVPILIALLTFELL